mmetsp:Transcript_54085/g.136065  ORF Transcript_54085/g.136065 Transcript_54085/m.136065 type:complete len:208 (+) Transcript_54085:421-1044(+)
MGVVQVQTRSERHFGSVDGHLSCGCCGQEDPPVPVHRWPGGQPDRQVRHARARHERHQRRQPRRQQAGDAGVHDPADGRQELQGGHAAGGRGVPQPQGRHQEEVRHRRHQRGRRGRLRPQHPGQHGGPRAPHDRHQERRTRRKGQNRHGRRRIRVLHRGQEVRLGLQDDAQRRQQEDQRRPAGGHVQGVLRQVPDGVDRGPLRPGRL